jgi:short-chain fatty acids transporter
MKAVANFFDKLMRKYTPDPFIFALFLTFLTVVAGILYTPASFEDMVFYWGDAFWSLTPFTMQMVMIFIGGFVLASTAPVQKLLQVIAKTVKTPSQAVFAVTVVSCCACWLNWGFGLVIGGLFCREVIRVLPRANFRLMVASSYSGFLVWHGGLSGTIPLMVATEGNFAQGRIGRLIPIWETIFSPLNITIVVALMIVLPILNWYISKTEESEDHFYTVPADVTEEEPKDVSPAEKLEFYSIISRTAGALGLTYLGYKAYQGRLSLELNNICLFLLFFSLFLHKNIRTFNTSVGQAVTKVGPIILQFPFYAGMMGMLERSGLANMLASCFEKISTKDTFNLLTFYSAAFLNLFIPSGGGKWVVESPVVIQAAHELGTSLPMACMAVVWGDSWTNMIQPFFALPLLAIAGLKARDIMGYCIISLIVSGIIISVSFMIFA